MHWCTGRLFIVSIFLLFHFKAIAQSALDELISSVGLSQNSTCLLIFDGTYTCTGFLINDGFQSGRPLVLTAAHCLPSGGEVSSVVSIFGRRKIGEQIEGLEWSASIGAQLLARSETLDYALFELSEAPPVEIQPVFLGWQTKPVKSQPVYSFHHPSFDFQQLAIHNGQLKIGTYPGPLATGTTPLENGHWQVRGYQRGTTTIGSSGCGLVNMDNQALGVLSGGQSSTFYSLIDYYSRMDLIIEDMLRKARSVLNHEIVDCQAFSLSQKENTRKISNYNALDTVSQISSYLAGNEVVEQFAQIQSGTILGFYISIHDWNADLLNDLSVTLVTDEGEILYEENINLFDLTRGTENYIPFIQPIATNQAVSISLRLNSFNASEEILFAHSSGSKDSHFFSLLVADVKLNEKLRAPDPAILIYPNPSSSSFVISVIQPKSIELIHATGRIFNPSLKMINTDSYLLDLSVFDKGIYFVYIITEKNQHYVEKIILR